MLLINWYKALSAYVTNKHYTLTKTDGSTLQATGNNYYTPCIGHKPSTGGGNSPMMTQLGKYNGGTPGIVFGDGAEPVTLNDYTLSGNAFTNHTGTVDFTAAIDEADISVTMTSVCTLTNTGSEDFTIREVGLYVAYGGSTSNPLLYERTLLDSPVTIPASGVGQVTYTIKLKLPTA